ncbi:unnamed protein product, partial [Allacma fusca]
MLFITQWKYRGRK